MLKTRMPAALVAALLLSLLLAACGGASPAAEPTAAPAAEATAAPAAEPTAAPAEPTAEPTTAPAEATAEAMTEPTAEATTAPADATAAATAEPAAEAAGGARTFRIVPEQSEASYAVQETFLRQNLPFRAVGKTSAIEGEFQFSADGKPTGQVTKITVDLSTLTSDDDRRDGRIRSEWLESAKFPSATFVSTGVEGVPESYTEGQEVSFKLLGDMTIRDVTNPVVFDVTGKLEGDTVVGTARTTILMTDFGFEPPQIAGFVAVQNEVEVNVAFTAKESS